MLAFFAMPHMLLPMLPIVTFGTNSLDSTRLPPVPSLWAAVHTLLLIVSPMASFGLRLREGYLLIMFAFSLEPSVFSPRAYWDSWRCAACSDVRPPGLLSGDDTAGDRTRCRPPLHDRRLYAILNYVIALDDSTYMRAAIFLARRIS